METNNSTPRPDSALSYRDRLSIEILPEEISGNDETPQWAEVEIPDIPIRNGNLHKGQLEAPQPNLVIDGRKMAINGIHRGIILGSEYSGRRIRPEGASVFAVLTSPAGEPKLLPYDFPEDQPADSNAA